MPSSLFRRFINYLFNTEDTEEHKSEKDKETVFIFLCFSFLKKSVLIVTL